MEACASSHHWARELIALGHAVKLMPAQYVKPYVKRDRPYPGGESWRSALQRVDRFLDDLLGPLGERWAGGRVLIIGHVATKWALDRRIGGRRLEDLLGEDLAWREGWDYDLDSD